jgi:hypothetical protein
MGHGSRTNTWLGPLFADGIATYAQAGAQFGFALSWVMLTVNIGA